MTPLQRLETAILTLKAHQQNPNLSPLLRRDLEAGARDVIADCAIAALASIEIANARHKANATAPRTLTVQAEVIGYARGAADRARMEVV
jgi:hypothetical protein